MRIKHPAYATERGRPSRATIGTEDFDIDDDGYVDVEDEALAVQAMERLGLTYGVEYTDDGEIESDATPAITRVEESDDSESTKSESTDTEADDGEALAEAGADALDRREELEAMERDDLRDEVRSNPDVDEDEINLNKTEEMVAALMRADAESVSDA